MTTTAALPEPEEGLTYRSPSALYRLTVAPVGCRWELRLERVKDGATFIWPDTWATWSEAMAEAWAIAACSETDDEDDDDEDEQRGPAGRTENWRAQRDSNPQSPDP